MGPGEESALCSLAGPQVRVPLGTAPPVLWDSPGPFVQRGGQGRLWTWDPESKAA